MPYNSHQERFSNCCVNARLSVQKWCGVCVCVCVCLCVSVQACGLRRRSSLLDSRFQYEDELRQDDLSTFIATMLFNPSMWTCVSRVSFRHGVWCNETREMQRDTGDEERKTERKRGAGRCGCVCACSMVSRVCHGRKRNRERFAGAHKEDRLSVAESGHADETLAWW